MSQRLDQAAIRARSWFPTAPPTAWSGHASPAVLTVNYNTTEALKLMLLTLSQQSAAKRIARVVVIDQCSRDDPEGFLPQLAATCPRILLITRRWRLHHAPGMRAGQRALARSEQDQPAFPGANLLLYVDPDIAFLRPELLQQICLKFEDEDAAFLGQFRRNLFPRPEAQASFLAVRRDWAERRGISPWVHAGSPAWFQQRDLWAAGAKGVDFPVFRQAYALHPGRTAVNRAARFRPWSSYASEQEKAHFMGEPMAAEHLAALRQRHAGLLGVSNGSALLEALKSSPLGCVPLREHS
ncbi:MAG: glycosyltransferase [Xanthomonadales bacterium]|nr:glycosyltransferase [Xanthomonadales bacterium]